MSRLMEAFDALRVEVASPRNAATVRVTRQNETRVKVRASAREWIDEQTMADEVAVAVNTAWREIKAQLHVLAHEHGLYRSRAGSENAGDEARTNRLRQSLPLLDAVAKSKHVEARISGAGEVAIRFLRNAVRRTDLRTGDLEAELTQTIELARRDWVRRLRQTCMDMFQSRQ